MQLIGRVIFLAICVFTAHSMPNLGARVSHEDSVYELLVAQVRSALIDTRALSPDESACANTYNNRTQEINNNLTNSTNTCFEHANRTADINTRNSNVTITAIKADLLTVQMQLANCTSFNDTTLFLNCVTTTHDRNIETLDRANSQSTLLATQLQIDDIEININRIACVSVAVSQTKSNLTTCADDYQKCLNKIPNQRAPENVQFNLPEEETPVNFVPAVLPVVDDRVVVPPTAEAVEEFLSDI